MSGIETRLQKSFRNIFSGVISKVVLMIFAFSTKTIFIRLLGSEYNGVNGLFTNILSILALSELGIGNVLNYSLYQALKQNDEEKIRSVVFFFKRIYRCIACAVFLIGIILIPFLRFIINSELPQNEILMYYVLYLLNSVASYLVVYKTTLIVADQNSYIQSICSTISTVVMYVLQIVYLFFFKDFTGYLFIQVLCTILQNVVLSKIADRRYPYVNHGSINSDVIDKKQMYQNIKATFMYKVSAVILNNIDNILISTIAGTIFVGYYSNYKMLVTYIASFISIFVTGITASLGNLNAESDSEASYNMFGMLTLIFSFISTVVACCFLNCMQIFIPIWIGPEHVMPYAWVIAIVLNNYMTELMNPIWMFRETMGLFKEVQYLMLITAVLNLIFSVVLGIVFGVPGILIATVLAKLVSQYWYEPKILFEKRFNKKVSLFFVNQIRQVLAGVVACVLSCFICKYIPETIFGLSVRVLISALIAIICVFAFNVRTPFWDIFYCKYVKKTFRILVGGK